MSNVNIILTNDQTDALMTVLSGIEGGSVLQGLYEALKGQMGSRRYGYRLTSGRGEQHNVHEVLLHKLEAR